MLRYLMLLLLFVAGCEQTRFDHRGKRLPAFVQEMEFVVLAKRSYDYQEYKVFGPLLQVSGHSRALSVRITDDSDYRKIQLGDKLRYINGKVWIYKNDNWVNIHEIPVP